MHSTSQVSVFATAFVTAVFASLHGATIIWLLCSTPRCNKCLGALLCAGSSVHLLYHLLMGAVCASSSVAEALDAQWNHVARHALSPSLLKHVLLVYASYCELHADATLGAAVPVSGVAVLLRQHAALLHHVHCHRQNRTHQDGNHVWASATGHRSEKSCSCLVTCGSDVCGNMWRQHPFVVHMQSVYRQCAGSLQTRHSQHTVTCVCACLYIRLNDRSYARLYACLSSEQCWCWPGGDTTIGRTYSARTGACARACARACIRAGGRAGGH